MAWPSRFVSDDETRRAAQPKPARGGRRSVRRSIRSVRVAACSHGYGRPRRPPWCEEPELATLIHDQFSGSGVDFERKLGGARGPRRLTRRPAMFVIPHVELMPYWPWRRQPPLGLCPIPSCMTGAAALITGQSERPSPIPRPLWSSRSIRRYARVPVLPSGQLRLPPALTGLMARLRHSASRAAVRRHRPQPRIGGVKALSGQPDGQPPAKVPVLRGAPGSSRGAPVGARGGATAQSCACGAQHTSGQRRTDNHRRDAPSPRADPADSDRGHGQRARLLGADRTVRTASSAGLLANAATVIDGNGPPAEPGGDQVAGSHKIDETRICPGHKLASAWKPTSGEQPPAGEVPDPNTRTAAQPAAAAVLCCCTARSICSNFAF